MADNFNISDVPESAGPKSVEVPGDIADGTAGELMTWDAAGVSSLVAVGTSSHVLTSNGPGAAPTFQAGGAAGVTSFITRTGAVVAVASDYDASQVDNDSGVAGAFVDDALDTLAAAIPPAAPVDSVFSRIGAVVAVAGDYAASEVTNDSGVAGANVDDALDTLAAASAPVDSVFARTGAVVAAASDYDASQVDNDSNIAGAFVDDALNNLDNAAAQARRTTSLAFATTWADVPLDATDLESNTAVIDHEAGTNDRITLVLDGVYEIHYHFACLPVDETNTLGLIEARVRVNDTTVLNGSTQLCSVFDDNSIEGNDLTDGMACSFLYQATATDFITLQVQYTQISGDDPLPDMAADCTVTVKRLTQ